MRDGFRSGFALSLHFENLQGFELSKDFVVCAEAVIDWFLSLDCKRILELKRPRI